MTLKLEGPIFDPESSPLSLEEIIGKRVKFATGNEAMVWGALFAGCRVYAGYPITPATEIMEGMAKYLPLINGLFLQMEDEIAAISAIIGASWNGYRTMTATSGPGFSLMQENIGYAVMTETPCVIVDVMRSGPSTGQPTMPAQGDFMQARWGSHGDQTRLVLAPSTVQECFDVMITAFNLADKYRVPVIVLSDAELAHLREKLVLPEPNKVHIVPRPRVTIAKEDYHPFRTGYSRATKVPEMQEFGEMYPIHLTGLTHDVLGHPTTQDSKVHKKLVQRFYDKLLESQDDNTIYEEYQTEDCEILLISYGITARSCKDAVDIARREGKNVGLLRLITLWPFPREAIRHYAKRVEKMVVAELAIGQMVHKVIEYVQGKCDVQLVSKIGGHLLSPQRILEEQVAIRYG